MGVKELWGILAPAKHEIPLESLKGEVVAVDLSVWICENNNVKAVQGRVIKPHLRNLFFRVSNLIQMGVKLVFVVDGEPPQLKWETMASRVDARYPTKPGRGRGQQVRGQNQKMGRSHFTAILRECQELLDSMGVPHLQSKGEAEALAALLNKEGLVDACLTEDGDVFLYGATKVYKNFNLIGKKPVIDCYNMSDIEAQLGLDRQRLVALALFLGCDYLPKGVPGVGKVQAMELLSEMAGVDVLQRFQEWRDGVNCSHLQVTLMPRPPHCSKCQHAGSAREHKQKGCSLCDGLCVASKKWKDCTCPWHEVQLKMGRCTLERDVMRKALTVKGFPRPDIIQEYMQPKDKCPWTLPGYKRPKVLQFESFLLKKLEWPVEYSREKILPLIIFYDLTTRWSPTCKSQEEGQLLPVSIVKRRVKNFTQCLEVEWVLPEKWKLEGDDSGTVCTIERLDLFESLYPQMVQAFVLGEADKISKKGRKTKNRKIKQDIEEASQERETPCLDKLANQLGDLTVSSQETDSPVFVSTKHHTNIQDLHTGDECSKDDDLSLLNEECSNYSQRKNRKSKAPSSHGARDGHNVQKEGEERLLIGRIEKLAKTFKAAKMTAVTKRSSLSFFLVDTPVAEQRHLSRQKMAEQDLSPQYMKLDDEERKTCEAVEDSCDILPLMERLRLQSNSSDFKKGLKKQKREGSRGASGSDNSFRSRRRGEKGGCVQRLRKQGETSLVSSCENGGFVRKYREISLEPLGKSDRTGSEPSALSGYESTFKVEENINAIHEGAFTETIMEVTRSGCDYDKRRLVGRCTTPEVIDLTTPDISFQEDNTKMFISEEQSQKNQFDLKSSGKSRSGLLSRGDRDPSRIGTEEILAGHHWPQQVVKTKDFHSAGSTPNMTTWGQPSLFDVDTLSMNMSRTLLKPADVTSVTPLGTNGMDINGIDTNGVDTNERHTNDKDTNVMNTTKRQTNGNDTNDTDTNRHTSGNDTNAMDTTNRHTNGNNTISMDTNGRHTNGKHTNGRDTNGRDTNGRDINGRHTNSGASCLPREIASPVSSHSVDETASHPLNYTSMKGEIATRHFHDVSQPKKSDQENSVSASVNANSKSDLKSDNLHKTLLRRRFRSSDFSAETRSTKTINVNTPEQSSFKISQNSSHFLSFCETPLSGQPSNCTEITQDASLSVESPNQSIHRDINFSLKTSFLFSSLDQLCADTTTEHTRTQGRYSESSERTVNGVKGIRGFAREPDSLEVGSQGEERILRNMEAKADNLETDHRERNPSSLGGKLDKLETHPDNLRNICQERNFDIEFRLRDKHDGTFDIGKEFDNQDRKLDNLDSCNHEVNLDRKLNNLEISPTLCVSQEEKSTLTNPSQNSRLEPFIAECNLTELYPGECHTTSDFQELHAGECHNTSDFQELYAGECHNTSDFQDIDFSLKASHLFNDFKSFIGGSTSPYQNLSPRQADFKMRRAFTPNVTLVSSQEKPAQTGAICSTIVNRDFSNQVLRESTNLQKKCVHLQRGSLSESTEKRSEAKHSNKENINISKPKYNRNHNRDAMVAFVEDKVMNIHEASTNEDSGYRSLSEHSNYLDIRCESKVTEHEQNICIDDSIDDSQSEAFFLPMNIHETSTNEDNRSLSEHSNYLDIRSESKVLTEILHEQNICIDDSIDDSQPKAVCLPMNIHEKRVKDQESVCVSSPVSLMDRLKHRSCRNRSILKSMELE